MHPVTSSVPNAVGNASREQRWRAEAGLLRQLAPRCGFWRLTASDAAHLASATQRDMRSSLTRVQDRHRPPLRRPHAADASAATRCGRAGNRGGKLSARQSLEVTKARLVQDLTWRNLYTRPPHLRAHRPGAPVEHGRHSARLSRPGRLNVVPACFAEDLLSQLS